MKINAKAFAKVNPYLKVKGLREDGYHQLDIGYLTINLADKITIRPNTEDEIEISTEANLSTKENLCYKVAVKLKSTCGVKAGAKITLKKEIPIGGGLGGGSSDAATTLICLNRLWDCNLSRRSLIDIGKEFGADIPFFFYGGYCTGSGTGVDLQQKENIFQDRLIPLVFPPFSQLTSEVYAKYDQIFEDSDASQTKAQNFLQKNTIGLDIENDLQKPALQLNPGLSEYLNLFQNSSTIATSGLAGSGSCVFGISRADVSPNEIRQEIEKELNSISERAMLKVAKPTNTGQLVQQVKNPGHSPGHLKKQCEDGI
ncbi:4-(cytidine 5'-diphospho)-2-C-methyl-D-erythritol kinase [Candidatus Bipolaricaulota bacterium]|nr:4-(cytidine 5'-diphospho)-2-C-methyl-D-erythritol kinase [Candidatus Bipolaricaulota bacterium]MBS3813792.1 4-(cytidine 5'-diphospho)-2-C-methyl-D-erythritol kinase [Candidatus Bipolaricaulota bacterium]